MNGPNNKVWFPAKCYGIFWGSPMCQRDVASRGTDTCPDLTHRRSQSSMQV